MLSQEPWPIAGSQILPQVQVVLRINVNLQSRSSITSLVKNLHHLSYYKKVKKGKTREEGGGVWESKSKIKTSNSKDEN